MSFGSIRKTSLAMPSARAMTKKARSAGLVGRSASATAIRPIMTAGLATYSSRRVDATTATQSAMATTPVPASRTRAVPLTGELRAGP